MFTVLCWTHRIFIVKSLWDDKNQTYICTHTTPGGRRKHCGLPDKEISRKQMPPTAMTSWIYVVMTGHVLAIKATVASVILAPPEPVGWACNTLMDSARRCRARGRQTKTNHNAKASLLLTFSGPSSFHKTASRGGPGKRRTRNKRQDCCSCRMRRCAYDQHSVLCNYPGNKSVQNGGPQEPIRTKVSLCHILPVQVGFVCPLDAS